MSEAGSRHNRQRGRGFLLVVMALLALSGCDAATRYKVLSTIFDGVPRLPPAEEYCQDHARQSAVSAGPESIAQGTTAATPAKGSEHPPFVEKRCNDCHDFSKPDGLLRPKRELCALCHKDFIQGAQVHGPVAVGDCLACHHPHNSAFTSLLLADKSAICAKCHREERLAARMHGAVGEHAMNCSDCHNPHFGQAEYFLD